MSSPMIAWVPLVNRLHRYFTTSDYSAQSIDLPSVKIHDVETAPEKRSRTLKHLLKANHVNHSLLYHDLRYHNHMPHLLGSAYLLGANAEHLQNIYDEEAKELEEWKDSPAEVTETDWREFLGQKKHQRAYVDFFEDELALKFDYNWRRVAEEYLFQGKEPLIHGVIGGRMLSSIFQNMESYFYKVTLRPTDLLLIISLVGHPLIHLAYAYELSSRELAMEGLAMTASSYNYLHKYLDDPSYTKPSSYSTTSPLEILQKIHNDIRFENLFSVASEDNIDTLFSLHESLILEHWNAWSIVDPIKQFRDSQEAAVALLVRTVKPGTHAYDFFLVHTLTTSHAVRVLLPLIPRKFHISLVRAWLLLILSAYVSQLRPAISEDLGTKPTKTWKYVEEKAVSGPYSLDAHYVKALRAIREAAFTWGDVHEGYLGAAIEFADGFRGWTGFGSEEEESLG